VSSCASRFSPIEIFDGVLDGNTVTFKCKSLDSRRTLTFAGRITGDEIRFKWDKSGPGQAADSTLFGDDAPRELVVKRVNDPSNAVEKRLAAETSRIRRAPAVTFEDVMRADETPQNWLTYSGNLRGWRHSGLKEIAPGNIKDLELAWLYQARGSGSVATPLVVDGVMYTVLAPNTVVALDAATGRELWTLPYSPDPRARASGGGGRPNRGLAISGGTLFLGTLDAHLLAIDAYTGSIVWNAVVADAADPSCMRCVITHAPLVVKDTVIVGVGGGDFPTRCFIAAFSVSTGKEVWRFYTVPAPGEPGSETWSGESWRTGGAGVWNSGSYDPELNLTYWGTGNPYPPSDGDARPGDNLYSNSVVALDADTGRLKWHYQFTPHDEMDWDSAQIPVLIDSVWQGRPRKLMLWANRNGLWYVLDRASGEFLRGQPFVEVNWMSGFDAKGRVIRTPIARGPGVRIFPGIAATQWLPPSYSPSSNLFYVPAWERPSEGGAAIGGKAYSAIRAFDPISGTRRWQFVLEDAWFSGILSTAAPIFIPEHLLKKL
jgi:alcohol dehydrogenase (cytochrome c)